MKVNELPIAYGTFSILPERVIENKDKTHYGMVSNIG